MFQSSRQFQLWDYNVSHQQLLLRSPKSQEEETNVDLIFHGVEQISLPTSLAGVQIVAQPFDGEIATRERLSTAGTVYVINSEGKTGWIVAYGCWAFENRVGLFESTLQYYAADAVPDCGELLAEL